MPLPKSILARRLAYFGFPSFYGMGGEAEVAAPAGPYVPLTYPINTNIWDSHEATLDSQTRQATVSIPGVPQQTGKLIGVYRGSDPAGNLSQIGTMTYTGGGYYWTASGKGTRGAKNYTRLAIRPADLSGPWTWLTGPADLKEFNYSDVPAAPSGTWAPLVSGSVRITLAPWNGKGRNVTSGEYKVGAGAWTGFASAAAGLNTTLDVTGLTDGVDTAVSIRWVNANVDSSNPAPALTLTVAAATPVPVPPAPVITYTVDGSGTRAIVAFDGEGVLPESILTVRYRLGGGGSVVVTGPAPVELTGLYATQTFEAEWSNVSGYSATSSISLYAALPTYGAGDWSADGVVDADADKAAIAFSADPTPPDGITLLGRQWTCDGGAAWHDFDSSPVVLPAPDVLYSIQVRGIYSIGPGIASAAKTVQPAYPAPAIAFPTILGPVTKNTGNVSQASMGGITFPVHEAGDRLVVVSVHGNDYACSLSGGPWTRTRIGGSVTEFRMYLHECIATAAGTTATLTISSSSGQIITHAFVVKGSDSVVVGPADSSASSTASAVDLANFVFAGGVVTKAAVIAVLANLGVAASQSAGLSDGFSARTVTTSATTTNGRRLASQTREVGAANYDAPAWPDTMAKRIAGIIAFLPAVGAVPTTDLTVSVSSTSVEQGDSVSFDMTADGDEPITYSLTFDGVTETNLTGKFSVLPSFGVKAWSASATNDTGSASASGSVAVAKNLVFSISPDTIYSVTFDAASVPHTVTPASYELEWGLVGGSTAVIAQESAAIPVLFPANGAYRVRVRGKSASAVFGDWSDWCYYAPVVVEGVSFPIQNAQAVQIGPLSAQAPVEVVPVSGKTVRLYEPRPAFTTEVNNGRTYYLNGVAINPIAGTGLGGNQFWDSRQGDKNDLDATASGFFSLSKVHTSWPANLKVDDTVSKARSRPTASLYSTGNGQGYRTGIIDQHAGLVVVTALSTTSPMQCTPAIIKGNAWVGGNVALPGWQGMLDALAATTLSTSGITLPARTTLLNKMRRFNPAHKLMRGGNYWENSQEAVSPYDSCPSSAAGNYYMYQNDAEVATLLISDAVDNDWKREMLGAYVLRGINIDYPGVSTRIGAGINQALLLPVALSRIARGQSLLDLGSTQVENIPYNYGFWDATNLTYLEPHTSTSRPVFARRRVISAVLADSASGHDFIVPWNNNTLTGELKQRMQKLVVVRESTGEELPWRATDGDMSGKRTADGTLVSYNAGYQKFATTGFFTTPLVAGEVVYLKIPASAMGGFAIGQPFWMYEAPGRVFEWQSFNPSPSMSYRDINEPQGKMMLLHALGAWPNVPGSCWDACKQYTIKSRLGSWPGSGFDYGFTASGFVSDMWGAHATTLGLTL